MKPFKNVFSKLELMLAEELMTLKENSDYWLKKFKDSMVSLRKRTTKLEPLEVKSNKLKKILDFQQLKLQRWVLNLLTTETDSKQQTKSLKLTSKRSRNC